MIINCKKIICKSCETHKTWEEFVQHLRVQKSNTCSLPKQNKKRIVPCASANLLKTIQIDQMNKTTDSTHSNTLFRQRSEHEIQKEPVAKVTRVTCLLQTSEELELLKQEIQQLKNEIVKKDRQIVDLQKEVNFLIKQLMLRENFPVNRAAVSSADLKTLYNTPSR